MIYTYTVLPHGAQRPRKVKIDFTPYVNEMSHYNDVVGSWDVSDKVTMKVDKIHPITLDSKGAMLVSFEEFEHSFIKTELELEPDTEYFFSTYVRNNDVSSTTLELNGEFKMSVINPYTQRIYGIGKTDEEGKLEIKLNFYDITPTRVNAVTGQHLSMLGAWLDGFMVVKTEDGDSELSSDDILEKYQYVRHEKKGPSAYDLLNQMFHFSPFRYRVSINGRKVLDYNKPLVEYGATEDSHLQTEETDWDTQIFNAYVHDIPLMAMLEGKRSHVSHAFPKEDDSMSRLHESHFPRLQFFTGFAVNTMISDTEPIADEVNFAVNIYIPVTKVLESVTAMMILTQISSIMSELGWAKIRGSDYFLKNEQLYVLQGQYIQDMMLKKKRK